jgi:uncharacterized protein (DUF983 family)
MSTLASLLRYLLPQADQTESTAAQALMRGVRGRCPNCGRGKMFSRFLKVADRCPECGEELFHQRADDFPAYLVILLVGHIVVSLELFVETEYAPAIWLQIAVWVPLTIGLALGLIQPIKGTIVALQWFGGMDGFEPARAQSRSHALQKAKQATASNP